MICINLVHGCALHSGTIFILFLRGAILIGPPSQKKKLELPNRHSSLDPKSQKLETNMFYLFSFSTRELNFGQTIQDKTEVLFGS